MKKTQEEVIKEFKEVHGDKYDYSLVKYIDARTRVDIICRIHGSFPQYPYEHKKGSNCRKCSRITGAKKKTLKREKVLEEFTKVHGQTYDYSKFKYEKSDVPSIIICKIHGEFPQSYSDHRSGKGCSDCSVKKVAEKNTLSQEEFLSRCSIHNFTNLDFSNTVYKGMNKYVEVICKKHGSYPVKAKHLANGVNCKDCSYEKATKEKHLTQQQFLDRAYNIFGNLYSYENTIYTKMSEEIKVFCNKHKYTFNVIPGNHLYKQQRCPKCSKNLSKPEEGLRKFVKKLDKEIKFNDRRAIKPLELDVLLPKRKIAFELNGIYWHKEDFVGKNYHRDKTIACKEKGIRLIHIFEDEWNNKSDIVKSRISNLLNFTSNKIYGRQCEIKKVSSKECKKFLNYNHIQGNVNSSVKLGLYYEEELVSIMTFGKLRKSLGQSSKEGSWELLRFCNKINTLVLGAASKLLKHFEKNYKPEQLTSYADYRWSEGDLYNKLGFNFIHLSEPNYFYLDPKHTVRYHRYNFTKHKLVKEGYDKDKTEKEIMKERGYHRIYDCGSLKFVKKYN